jgi:hypothetical protein
MTKLFQFAAPLLAPLLLFPTASAQFRGGARSWRPVPIPPSTHAQAPAPVVPSRPSATPPVIAGPVNRVNGAAHVAQFEHIDHPNFPNVRCVAGGESIGVPGLGFDFPHLAAISQPCNLPIFRHDGFDLGNSLSPTLFGGYPGFTDSGEYSDSPPAQQQPQIIVIQLPTPVAVSGSANPASQEPVDSPVAAPTPPPTADAPDSTGPDLSPFILVKRDGRVVFASAFSINATQLRYITPEGIRRTVFLSDLDVEATQRMNEENGAVIRLRN